MPYHVLIIEDDSMVAAIDRQYVESDRRFQVDRVFKNGLPALDYLAEHRADLVILDYYTPQMNGQEFLDRLLALPGPAPAVIAVTSANDPDIVQALLQRGVLDYLIKPFVLPRFRQAMDRFLQRQSLLTQHSAGVDQQTIDRLIQLPETPPPAEELSKGLNLSTLSMIREFLSAHPGEALTSEQIAAQVHLSRITVRRYVSHMVETHELESSIDYRTGGRPSIQYRYVGT